MPDATAKAGALDEEKKIAKLVATLKTGERYQLKPHEKEFIYNFLVSPRNPSFHWYCIQAPELRKEVATYAQIWLVSDDPNSEPIVQWREQHGQVLSTCCDCVVAMEDALIQSQFTYLSSYKKDKVAAYLQEYNRWNITRICSFLDRLHPQATFGDLPLAVSYHIFYNTAILGNSKIWPIIKIFIPNTLIRGWPERLPAGLLLMLCLEDTQSWASLQLSRMHYPETEGKIGPRDSHYLRTLASLLLVLAASGKELVQLPTDSSVRSIFHGYSSAVLWSNIPAVIKGLDKLVNTTVNLPGEGTEDAAKPKSLISVVVSQLSRQDKVFPLVLKAFGELLRFGGTEVWKGQSPELPQVAFDAIKDNKAFSSLELRQSNDQSTWLGWLDPFLQTIVDLNTYSEVLRRVLQAFAEELQHERFKNIRPALFAYLMTALLSSYKSFEEAASERREAVIQAINIHIRFVTAVAFDKRFSSSDWKSARKHTKKLLLELLVYDTQQVYNALTSLPSAMRSKDSSKLFISPSYRGLWQAVRSTLNPGDPLGYAFLIVAIARSSHLVPFPPERLSEDSDSRKLFLGTLKEINAETNEMHRSFETSIMQIVNSSTDAALEAFCSRDEVAPCLLTLLLSPNAELSSVAQTLVGQAYNADSRVECFRALLENSCDIAISGMIAQLKSFIDAVTKYLEAVAVAKILVRCFTDILEVMCARGSGLLFNESFKAKNQSSLKRLPTLWKYMCQAASTIIKRTPNWAEHYPSAEMVVWMRDALIFAEELVAQRQVFEFATLIATNPEAAASSSPSKMSPSGSEMVTDLGGILSALGAWLRLTNQELLDRSYQLIITLFDAFKMTNVQPEEGVISSLETTTKKLSRSPDPSAPKSIKTKLSLAQIGTIDKHIRELKGELEDSDIEYIGESKRASPPIVVTKPLPPPKKPMFDLKSKQPAAPQPLRSGVLSTVKSSKTSKATKDGLLRKSLAHPQEGPSFRMDNLSIQLAIAERKEAKAKAAAKAAEKVVELSSSANEAPDSSSDDSVEEVGLKQLGDLHKSPEKIKRPVERRTAILMNQTKPVTRMVAQAGGEPIERRARYIPDMTPLHRIILSWDYSFDGPEPPNTGTNFKLRPVPDLFTSHRHYLDVFYPLLVVECWSSLIKSKEEQLDQVECSIAGKMHADVWVEIDTVIEQAVPKGWMLMETDIVLLKHPSKKQVLCKVHSARQTKKGIQATLRYLGEKMNVEDDRTISIQSVWLISRVFSLSTLHREYAALMSMHHYDWTDAVYQARISPPFIPPESDIKKTMEAFRLNSPQAKAILSSLGTGGFSLIQGPPGTGKTSTICGLVGLFLSNRTSPTTIVKPGRNPHKSAPRKVLICAPSNAAIDEVAKRLKEGVWKSDGTKVIPNVVRVGTDASINVSVKDISLDQLVQERLIKTTFNPSENSFELASIHSEIEAVKHQRQEKLEELQASHNNSARALQLDKEAKELMSKKIQLSSRLTAALDKGRETARAIDSAKRNARTDVLNECDVVCSTLSGAGHEILEQFDFDLVVIDEAAQAIELSSLIPLKFSSSQCVLVGDPQQLPPTVISQTATKLGYNQSLFVRLQKARPERMHLLSIQYRMHPEISTLPSNLFYDGKIQDGPNMATKTAQPWHRSPIFGVYKFFDVRGEEEQAERGHSQLNMSEARMALSLYTRLRHEFPEISFDYRIGIISMYRAQLVKMKALFANKYGREVLSKIDFNTVDGFQGQEKDIIILSCVRAGPSVTSIGFLSDRRRMNVAITRSRSSLFILGHTSTLKRSDEVWRKIVEDASERKLLVNKVEPSYFSLSNPLDRPEPVPSPSPSPQKSRPVVAALPPPSRPSGSLTLKEWKERNSKKITMEAPTVQKETSNGTENPQGNTSDQPIEVDSLPSSSLKRQREADDDDPERPPPALRNGAAESGNPSVGSGSSIKPPAPPVIRRPPPKPKAVNLFIPKKPPLKRPPPVPDSLPPDPKRRAT